MADIATLGIKVDSKGVVRATKDLDRLDREGVKAEKTASKLGKAFGVLAGALAGGAIFRSVIANTIEQERVTAQLEQTLRSTGRYTPQLSQQMQDYAASLQEVTTFGDEAIVGAQAMLLTFTQIGNETFPRAQEAILDVATAMGTDLKAATIQVGKALNDPIRGVTALAESGIQFTDAQRDMIKEMVETNRVADAQALILNELETQFGGSARAARDTLGGALTSLKNAFGDLLEGDSGGDGVRGATQAINDLTDVMSSSETKEAFGTITAAVFRLTSALTNGAVEFANFGDQIAINLANLTGNLDELDRLEQEIKDVDRAIKGGFSTPLRFLFTDTDELDRIRKQLVAERDALLAARGIVDQGIAKPNVPVVATGGGSGQSNQDQKKQREEVDKTAEAYRRLSNSLREQGTALLMTEKDAFIYQQTLKLINEDTDTASQSYKDMRDSVVRLADELYELQEAQQLANTQKQEAQQIIESLKDPNDLYIEQLQKIKELEDAGALTAQQAGEARLKAVDDLVAVSSDGLEQITTFAEEASRNIQNLFADNLFDFMQGEFEFTGDSFKKMLDRMVANAIAADLAGALFGSASGVAGATGDGLFGKLASSVGGLFGMGGGSSVASVAQGLPSSIPTLSFDGGGFTGSGSRSGGMDGKGGFPAMLHPNETVIDHSKGQKMGNVTVNVNVTGMRDSMDLRKSASQIAQQAGAAANRALARNG